MCRFQEPLFLGFLNLEDGGCQLLRKVDNYLLCVWSHMPEEFIAYQSLCHNFKLPNAEFLILQSIGSRKYRFLHYGRNSMHHHIDWKKNSCRKVLINLDYVLNLPLNEFKWGLWIALNYIVCNFIYIKKILHSQYKSLKGIIMSKFL